MSGVFCIEGDWYGDENRSATVRPLLDLLSLEAHANVECVYRNAATREELAHQLRRWGAQTTARVLYLAFHGAPGKIYLGEDRRADEAVSLRQIAAMMGSGLAGRSVHFGSCRTLSVDRRVVVRDLLVTTGLTAATGFASNLCWINSAPFDLLLLSLLVERRATVENLRRVERVLRAQMHGLRRELAFKIVTRAGQR